MANGKARSMANGNGGGEAFYVAVPRIAGNEYFPKRFGNAARAEGYAREVLGFLRRHFGDGSREYGIFEVRMVKEICPHAGCIAKRNGSLTTDSPERRAPFKAKGRRTTTDVS